MSYGVHIERKASLIGDGEWREFVRHDPSLHHLGVFQDTHPQSGELIEVEAPGLVEWLGHPQGRRVFLDHAHGRISVANPDEPTMELMLRIAAQLDAAVIGDEGESYS